MSSNRSDVNEQILRTVHDQYAAVARSGLSNEADAVRSLAASFGYSTADLASLPAEANMGLSCGNPVALASLRSGEVVVDLGCGGGMDVLLAAKRIGPGGKAIGIDMTADMLARARAGAEKAGATNVEFYQAQIDRLPLTDNSVDCIISNCVINLVPEKDKVFREMLRVLKPGGRLAISDIALKQPLPVEVKSSIEAYVGCIAGAILIEEYERQLQAAGFAAVVVTDTGADLNAYAQAGLSGTSCCNGAQPDTVTDLPQSLGCGGSADANSPQLHDQLASVLARFDANAYAASVRVHAIKEDHTSTPESTSKTMSRVQVYDKPMCCSTGVCGPQVDPVLPRFAADLEWLKSRGHQVERFNLAQDASEFVKNAHVQQMLAAEGVECLPLIVVDGRVVSRSEYPSRENLAVWTGTALRTELPVVSPADGCCGGSDCC
jgi:SAM-dependent methyltransferase